MTRYTRNTHNSNSSNPFLDLEAQMDTHTMTHLRRTPSWKERLTRLFRRQKCWLIALVAFTIITLSSMTLSEFSRRRLTVSQQPGIYALRKPTLKYNRGDNVVVKYFLGWKEAVVDRAYTDYTYDITFTKLTQSELHKRGEGASFCVKEKDIRPLPQQPAILGARDSRGRDANALRKLTLKYNQGDNVNVAVKHFLGRKEAVVDRVGHCQNL